MRLRTATAFLFGLAVVMATSACTSQPPAAPPVATPPPAPVAAATTPAPTSAPPTTTHRATTTTQRSTTTYRTTTRSAPTAGYQCRPGDELTYKVCAGHKRWVDGQVEFANCQKSGGAWNVQTQACTYPPRTKAPTTGLHNMTPGFRDSNGETRPEYCARTGQPIDNCNAG